MDAQTIILLILLGVIAGALSGLMGVGGGIIIIPGLIFLLAFSPKLAQGTSLGILLLPVGLLGVIQYYKQGYVDLRIVALISLGFIAGNYFGSKIALSLSQDILKKVFAIFLIIMAVKMLFFDDHSPEKTIENRTDIENAL